jgi:transposase
MRGRTLLPQEFDVFAGVDVDKRTLSVTFLSHHGFIRSVRMPYSVTQLLHHVHAHFAGQKVAFAYEAGPTGYGLYDGLTAHAYPCVLAAPAMIPRAPGQRVKTNRLDSVRLAEQLRGGHLRSIHVPLPIYRELRHLTQLRDTFGQQLAGMKLRIKSLLLLEGLPFPPAPPGAQWSARVKAALRDLPCAGAVRFKLDQLLASVAFAEHQARETTRAIRRLCQTDPELARCIQYLMTLPGFGWLVASQFLARVGDWRELPAGRQVAGFLGGGPGARSTGLTTVRGGITHTGDGRLRSKLIQAAWVAIRRDEELRAFYHRVLGRPPRDRAARVAIVAVARKLSARAAALLRHQRPYTRRDAPASAPGTPVETMPQGTPRRYAEPGGPGGVPPSGVRH